MTKSELIAIMDYIDAEFWSATSRMTDAEKIARAKHWKAELGDRPFQPVMTAVREISRRGFIPKTAEVIAILETPAAPTGARSAFDRIQQNWITGPTDETRDALDAVLYAAEHGGNAEDTARAILSGQIDAAAILSQQKPEPRPEYFQKITQYKPRNIAAREAARKKAEYDFINKRA